MMGNQKSTCMDKFMRWAPVCVNLKYSMIVLALANNLPKRTTNPLRQAYQKLSNIINKYTDLCHILYVDNERTCELGSTM